MKRMEHYDRKYWPTAMERRGISGFSAVLMLVAILVLWVPLITLLGIPGLILGMFGGIAFAILFNRRMKAKTTERNYKRAQARRRR